MEGVFRRMYSLRYRPSFLFKRTQLGKSAISLTNYYRDLLNSLIQSKRNEIIRRGDLISSKVLRLIIFKCDKIYFDFLSNFLDPKLCLLDFLSTELKDVKEEDKKSIIDDEMSTFIVTVTNADNHLKFIFLRLIFRVPIRLAHRLIFSY